MKRVLQFSSLIFGLVLLVGCSKPPEPLPPTTEAEYKEQQMTMQQSMEAGKKAAEDAKKAGGAPAPSQ